MTCQSSLTSEANHSEIPIATPPLPPLLLSPAYESIHPCCLLEEKLFRTQCELETYRRLYESTPSIYFTLDAEGAILSVNQFGAHSLGYEVPELLGVSVFTLFHPADQEPLQQDFRLFVAQAIATESPQSPPPKAGNVQWECRQQRRDGTVLWVKATAHIASPTAKIVLLNCEDITDRQQSEQVLQQQIHRERLVNAIAQRIRQSLELDTILSTTVAEVRQFLQAERVLIYRLEPDSSGTVVTESVLPGWVSLMGNTFPEEVFPKEHQHPYEQGRIGVIPDVSQATGMAPCLVEFLQQFQVQAKLVVPILQGQFLWGVLVVHQCSGPRQWQRHEIDLLQQLSIQVAIAIQQSQLYQHVQRFNHQLEAEVQERTAQLRKALEFEAVLKRITDKVRDHLDENQILQTAVQELAVALGIPCCNAALYDLEQRTSTIYYEYTTALPRSQGRVARMDNSPELYRQLLQGWYFQYCALTLNPDRGRVAMLACPIFLEAKIGAQGDPSVLGDLWLINHSEYGFSELEIRLVQQVANQCAIAIRQARLHQALHNQLSDLEKLNRLKDDFLSTVSHELRTPIANMKMAIQMLDVTLNGKLSLTPTELAEVAAHPLLEKLLASRTKAGRYLQILQNECNREIDLINDLLDLQRLEAGIGSLILESIDLVPWLNQLVKGFQERAQNRQQTLQVSLDAALPPLVSDPSKLERVLSELLHNACKYTPPGGSINLIGTRQNDWLFLSVQNQGVEIPNHQFNRIFDKFYRIPNADPWKQGGTGLGLALVKKLTEHLGGTIRVESGQGQTCFTLHLPLIALSEALTTL